MARYLVTSGSHFEPMSYQEIIAPLQALTEQHNAAADAYDAFALESGALDNFIDKENDPIARRMYEDYTNKLSTLQENLWKHGVTAGTRRDLAAARAGYANIGKLKEALQNRQERSKEYWDARHKNPSLITGADPSLSSLDSYLADVNYGRDWYSYSGDDFMNEVGADAKARAGELMRNPEITKNPELAGYLTRITQEGFSSDEVRNAGDAVEAVLSGQLKQSDLAGLSAPEQILADVLLSHVNSTGARDRVSPEEFSRLVKYGRAGLSQAIGKTEMKDFSDKVWEANQEWNMWKRKADYTAQAKAPTGTQEAPQILPYTLNDISTYMESAEAERINKTLGQIGDFKQPVIVTDAEGNSSVLNNAFDAEKVLNSFGKDEFYMKYGINPDKPTGKWKLEAGNGKQVEYRVVYPQYGDNPQLDQFGRPVLPDNGLGFGNTNYVLEYKNDKGKWVVDENMTREFNRDLDGYTNRVKNFEERNTGVNLKKLAISDKDREKIYKQYDIPSDVSFDDIPAILETRSKQGRVTFASIAGATDDMESTRQNYADQIIASHSRAGKIAKTSEYAFYPVDGFDIKDEGETDILNVFGAVSKNSNRPNDKAITEITVIPEDLAQNKVRISINGKQYAINPAMLGNDMDYQVQSIRQPVLYMMSPILDPVTAMRMGPAESAQWAYQTQKILGDYINLVSRTPDGQIVAASPRDVVENPELQGALRTAVTLFMNAYLAKARDNMMQNNYQTRGNSSAKAAGYNDYME